MTRSKDDEPELYNLLGTDEDRRAFAEEFKKPKSNFKIAIVVDMWTTGFDVDCLDTMYIDKPLQQHTLVQTISRVNRVYPGKEKGLMVDYIGIKNNMNVALKRYAQGGCQSGFGGKCRAVCYDGERRNGYYPSDVRWFRLLCVYNWDTLGTTGLSEIRELSSCNAPKNRKTCSWDTPRN